MTERKTEDDEDVSLIIAFHRTFFCISYSLGFVSSFGDTFQMDYIMTDCIVCCARHIHIILLGRKFGFALIEFINPACRSYQMVKKMSTICLAVLILYRGFVNRQMDRWQTDGETALLYKCLVCIHEWMRTCDKNINWKKKNTKNKNPMSK